MAEEKERLIGKVGADYILEHLSSSRDPKAFVAAFQREHGLSDALDTSHCRYYSVLDLSFAHGNAHWRLCSSTITLVLSCPSVLAVLLRGTIHFRFLDPLFENIHVAL